MSNLSTDQMIIAATTFQDALKHVLNNYVPETKKELTMFVGEIILRERPYMLLTAEGISHATDLVFGKDNHRDFIFSLVFTFFSRFGESSDSVNGLAQNIARGISPTVPIGVTGRFEEIVPRDISSRLVKEDQAHNLLAGNKWLMVLLMIPLFIELLPESTKPTKEQ